jgi:hypothetical protein
MPPAAFPTRFITTHYRCHFGEPTALVGLGHFLEHARLVARWDTPFARLVTVTDGDTELPGLFTQCTGHKQDTLCYGIMALVGRCRGHGLSPPWWSVEIDGKEAYQQQPI